MRKSGFLVLMFALATFQLQAQEFDALIRNGHVIDPKNNIDDIRDIAIANGRITLVQRATLLSSEM